MLVLLSILVEMIPNKHLKCGFKNLWHIHWQQKGEVDRTQHTIAHTHKHTHTYWFLCKPFNLQSFEGNLNKTLWSSHVWTGSFADSPSLSLSVCASVFQAVSPDLSNHSRQKIKVIPSLCFTMHSISDQRKLQYRLIKFRLFLHHLLYFWDWQLT